MTDVILEFDASFLDQSAHRARLNENEADSKIDWHSVTQLVAKGNQTALATFYQSHFDVMFREVKRCSGSDEQTCLDLVQEAMLKAIKCIKPIGSEASLATWCRAVAKSVTYDWLRKRARNPTSELLTDQRVAKASSDLFEDHARMLWIESELKRLPPSLRRMIDMRYRLGWSLAKIGESFGLKTGAVDGRIRRAVEQLRIKASEEFTE